MPPALSCAARARKGSTQLTSNRIPTLVLVVVCAAGCRQDMHNAPRYEAFEASTATGDNRASRIPPVGTVPRGWLRDDEALYTGKVAGQLIDQFPFAIAHADLARGQQRFNIYCTPCHGKLGDGNGMVVQRGLRQAASFHQDRLRQEKLGYFFDVITNGFGAMPDYATQVPVRDRWLIVAYVRALQFSQHASVNELPEDQRAAIAAASAATGQGAAATAGQGRTTAKPAEKH